MTNRHKNITEQHRPREAKVSSSVAPHSASRTEWREFQNQFEELARSEGMDQSQQLCAYCDYTNPPAILGQNGKPQNRPPSVIRAPENGLWTLDGNVKLQEQFRTLAARAGLALGTRGEADSEGVWLHGLYSYVAESHSEFLGPKIGGRTSALRTIDTVNRVCDASAMFCSRLERQALQISTAVAPLHQKTPELALKQRPGAKSKKRANYVEQVLHELEQIRPKMVNESHYSRVEQDHPRFKVFQIASTDSDVKSWIENIRSRKDMVKLAQEIGARHFREVTESTIQTDWSHRKA